MVSLLLWTSTATHSPEKIFTASLGKQQLYFAISNITNQEFIFV